MSLRPYRPRKRKAVASSQLTHSTLPGPDGLPSSENRARLVPVEAVPRQRLAPYTSQFHLPRVRSVFSLPDGRELAQLPQVRPDPTCIDGHSDTAEEVVEQYEHLGDGPQDELASSSEVPPPDTALPYLTFDGTEPAELRQTRAQAKKEKQWKTWATKTIPSLLLPYMKILRDTNSLRDKAPQESVPCPCGICIRQLKVVCVYFERESLFFSSSNLL